MKRILLLISLLSFTTGHAFAQNNLDLPPIPNPPKLVNDYTNLLSDNVQLLEKKLDDYSDSTTVQIAIVILPFVNDDISNFSSRLGNYWGIGSKEKDNGLLLVFDMMGHHVYIATGKGAEAFVTNETAQKIINYYILPNFKRQSYYSGLDQATTALMMDMPGKKMK